MKLYALLFLVFLAHHAVAQHLPSWGFQISDRLGAHIWDIAADSSGNIYACGNLANKNFPRISSSDRRDTAIFGDIFHEIPPFETQSFLAKFRPDGQLVWTKFVPGRIIFLRLAVNPRGDVYIGGMIDDTLTIDNVFLKTICLGDAFVARADSDGVFLWAERFGGLSYESIADVGCDQNGFIYAAGIFEDSLSCSIGTMYSKAKRGDMFIGRLDNFGRIHWIKDMNSDDLAWCEAIDVDPAGDVVFGGALDDKVYVIKLTSTGGIAYSRQYGIGENLTIADVLANPDNSFTMLVNIFDTADIGSTHINCAEGNSIPAVVTVRSNGSIQSVIRPTETSLEIAALGDALSRHNGALFITGQLSGMMQYGNELIESPDMTSSWILQFDTEQVPEWSHAFGNITTLYRRGYARILALTNGDLCVSGRYTAPFDVGSVRIGAPQDYQHLSSKENAFLINYSQRSSGVLFEHTAPLLFRCNVSPLGVTVESLTGSVLDIRLFDVLGKQVRSIRLDAMGQQSIDGLPTGVYLAVADHEGNSSTQHISILR